nr:MAG TPA: hypothetical protein [Microviridae sp.]
MPWVDFETGQVELWTEQSLFDQKPSKFGRSSGKR